MTVIFIENFSDILPNSWSGKARRQLTAPLLTVATWRRLIEWMGLKLIITTLKVSSLAEILTVASLLGKTLGGFFLLKY